ncbi:GNAT family N-acetyltransferase [Aquimarina mytili]|uniref:GNAT family N-acetyltransferase n=1 Tax=Aquimarina mytili TaxID=874423 RepID=A0A936ZTW6_9FLAO|nr:GNAT family N-acetyltransferase [Aquimarina mytili]MBL0685469.1 GNAT family N-acetyltransferase [Aquimarina mytili]
MNIELVKAKETDRDFLLDLRISSMQEHLHTAGLYLSNEEHKSRVDVHFDASQIILKSSQRIGLLKSLETQDNIEILQLQILPEFQGMRIGKHIIDNIISRAKHESKKVTLKVLKENPAKHLYERLGFKVTGEDQHEFYMEVSFFENG